MRGPVVASRRSARGGRSRSVELAVWTYSAAARLLPGWGSHRYRSEVIAMFAALAADARRQRGRLGVLAACGRGLLDLCLRARVERRLARLRRTRSLPPDHEARMQNLLHDLRQAARSVARAPLTSLLVVVTLALGIGVNTAVFSVVDAVLLEPLGYPDPDRLVVFHGLREGAPSRSGTIAYLNFADVRARSDAFAAAAYDEWRANLSGDLGAERVEGARVNVEFFRVLGVAPAAGRFFTDGEDRDGNDEVVVLSHGLWTRRYGADSGLIGSTIAINGRAHEVVGVASGDYEDPLLSGAAQTAPEIWRPLGFDGVAADGLPSRGSSSYTAVGRLADGVTIEAARAEVARIMADLEREYPDNNLGVGMTLLPLRERMVGDTRRSLLLVQAAVALVLAIATLNVGGLLLSRTAQRGGEVAVRAALGAGTARLARLLAAEVLWLALAAGAAGVLLARLALGALTAATAATVPRAARIELDMGILGLAALASLAVAVLCAGAPLAALRRADLRGALQPGGRGAIADGGARVRRRLVVLQAALSVVLLAGALLLGRSLWRLTSVDTGFETRDRLVFRILLPGTSYPSFQEQHDFMRSLLDSLSAAPGVESAATVNILPLSGSFDCNSFFALDRPEPEPNQGPCPETRTVAPSYFRTMGMELVAGRLLSEQDGPDSEWVAVVNQTFAEELWPGEDPLGRTIRNYQERPVRVVGVVRGVKHRRLAEEPESALYLPYAQNIIPWHPRGATVVIAAQTDPQALAGIARERVRRLDPDLPVSGVATLAEVVSASVATPRFRALLLGSFAALAVVLAMIGIYGTVSVTVARQRRDLAVRAALGASAADIRRQILWHGLGPVLAGIAIGLPGALAIGGLMRGMLFQVGPYDPLSLVSVAILLAAVACLSTWAPARRAASDDPVAALRSN